MSNNAGEQSGPSHATRARSLLRATRVGTLSTVDRKTGHPYGSLVRLSDSDGTPVLLLSTLAEHTRNLLEQQQCSLLLRQADIGAGLDPLECPRLSLLGQARQVRDPDELVQLREAYLENHPSAKRYVDFGDFDFWGVEVERARYVGGFGQMSWLTAGQWTQAKPDPMAPWAVGVAEHMNDDHRDALEEYVGAFTEIQDVDSVHMLGIDSTGFELRVADSSGKLQYPRIDFSEPVTSPADARKTLVQMVREARQLNAG